DPDDEGSPAMWVHDDAVEAGKTYRYRMRVELVNRFVGRVKSIQPVSAAQLTTLAGDWSEPTDPVTVAPSTRFYFAGAVNPPKAGEDQAVIKVDVFRWLTGKWVSEQFQV